MNWKMIRELFRQIHLWIGLIGGVFIFIISLSGAILVYEDEILHVLNSKVFSIEPKEISQYDYEDLMNEVSNTSGKQVVGFKVGASKDEPWEYFVREKGKKGRPETVYINPYTQQILGNNKELTGREFIFSVFKLHRWFLMDMKVGRPIVGFFTLVFVFSIFTGLVIWFPKKVKNYKQGLKVKWKANWKRVNHDFHNAFGLYSTIFLLILALTGLCWSFEWYKDGLSNLIGAKVFDRSEKEIRIPNDWQEENKPTNEVLTFVQNELSTYGALRYKLPDSKSKILEVNAYKKGFMAISIPDTYYYEYTSGKFIESRLFKDLAFNQKIAKSIHDLHMGYLFGQTNKFLFFLSAIIAALLPITGYLIWWNKRKKKPKKKVINY
ncbi:MAG: PepSY-associated TM helix domain-containing protein [Moheibacter sp.]